MEGFGYVHVMEGPEKISAVQIVRTPTWTDKRSETGPFDIIGDVHGCFEELVVLLGRLGYVEEKGGRRQEAGGGPRGAGAVADLPDPTDPTDPTDEPNNQSTLRPSTSTSTSTSTIGWEHPEGRKAIFVGDLADRGPGVVEAARLVMDMVKAGNAYAVPGNHDIKLMRYLQGKKVTVAHGLAESIEQVGQIGKIGLLGRMGKATDEG